MTKKNRKITDRRGAAAGALGRSATPLDLEERMARYRKQNGCERLTRRQKYRAMKKILRNGR